MTVAPDGPVGPVEPPVPPELIAHDKTPEPFVTRTCPDAPSAYGNVYDGKLVVPVLLKTQLYTLLMTVNVFDVTGAIRFDTTTLLVLMYGIVNVLKFMSIVVVLAKNELST
jgi:hypothetical protein